MQILLLSDTHGDVDSLHEVLQQNLGAGYAIHLGDIGLPYEMLTGFLLVKGNHDKDGTLPRMRFLEIENRKILCLHGDALEQAVIDCVMGMNLEEQEDTMQICMDVLYHKLSDYARTRGCDTVFFGHTHIAYTGQIDGVILVNPGSLYSNVGDAQHSYAIVDIKDDKLLVDFKTVI